MTRDLKYGLALGLLIATGLTGWVTFLNSSGGSAVFERAGTTYGTTILIYYLGFSIGGALLGSLAPIRRWAWGSMLLGFLFVLPVYVSVIVLQAPREKWFSTWYIAGVLFRSLLVGGGVGLWVWSNEYGKRRRE